MVCQSVSGSVLQSVSHLMQVIQSVRQQSSQQKIAIDSYLLFPQLLMPGQQFPWDHAKKPVNKNKNRYANIIACELTISLLCTAGSFQLYCYENWALSNESKPIARCFNRPNHSHHNVTICVLSLHHGNTESRKNLGQKFIFQLGTLYPHWINEHHSFH